MLLWCTHCSVLTYFSAVCSIPIYSVVFLQVLGSKLWSRLYVQEFRKTFELLNLAQLGPAGLVGRTVAIAFNVSFKVRPRATESNLESWWQLMKVVDEDEEKLKVEHIGAQTKGTIILGKWLNMIERTHERRFFQRRSESSGKEKWTNWMLRLAHILTKPATQVETARRHELRWSLLKTGKLHNAEATSEWHESAWKMRTQVLIYHLFTILDCQLKACQDWAKLGSFRLQPRRFSC